MERLYRRSYSYMLAALALVRLTGCAAHCNCPRCSQTTVVTPPGSTVENPSY